MDAVLSCVDRRVLPRGRGAAGPGRGPEWTATPEFRAALADVDQVEDELERDPAVADVVAWCTRSRVPRHDEVVEFVKTRITHVLLWLVVVPVEWYAAAEKGPQLMLSLKPWFVEGGLVGGPPGGGGAAHAAKAADLMRLMAGRLWGVSAESPSGTDARRRRAGVAVRLVAAAHARGRAVRAYAAAVAELRVPRTVPVELRDCVLLLAWMGLDGAVAVPHWISPCRPPRGGGRPPPPGLLERGVPATVPGLEFERAFAAAVFGDPDRPSLREALVFAGWGPSWAEEWRARGWSTSSAAQRGMAALAKSGWRLGPRDAAALVVDAARRGGVGGR